MPSRSDGQPGYSGIVWPEETWAFTNTQMWPTN